MNMFRYSCKFTHIKTLVNVKTTCFVLKRSPKIIDHKILKYLAVKRTLTSITLRKRLVGYSPTLLT